MKPFGSPSHVYLGPSSPLRARRVRTSAFVPMYPSELAASDESDADRANVREQKSGRAQAAAGVMFATSGAALGFPPPFGETAAAIGAVAGLGLMVCAGVRKRSAAILRGDKEAIAGFYRRVARWSPAKRKRKTEHYLEKLKRLQARQRRKGRRIRTHLRVEIAKIKLKLAALLGAYNEHKHGKKKGRLVPDDANTEIDKTENDPSADKDTAEDDKDTGALNQKLLIGGGLVAALVVVAIIATRRPNAE